MSSLPTNWHRRRLRFDARLNPVKSELMVSGDTEVSFVPMDAVGEHGGLRLDEQRLLDDVYNGFTYFRDGDVVVAKITPCFENGKTALAFGLVNGLGFGTTELHVLRAGKTLDARFLFYLTIAHDFRGYGEAEMLGAGGQKRVPERFFKDWRAPLSPLAVQERIAAFLDEKTAQIDALIEKKQQLLERLAEKRQAIITQAVTKGLNPATPMKDSGIDWLGQIPAHWDVLPLRRMVLLQRGHDLPSQDREDGDVLLVSSAGVIGQHSQKISDGPGIVTGRYGTVGDFYFVDKPYWPLNTTLYSREIMCLPQFGFRLLQTMSHLFVLNSLKSAVPGVDRNDVLSEHVPRPPMHEQVKIAEHITTGLDRAMRNSDLVARSLDYLTEYRSALITAAVTGRVKALK